MGTDIIGGDRLNRWGQTNTMLGLSFYQKLRWSAGSVAQPMSRPVPDNNNTSLWPNLQDETCKLELK